MRATITLAWLALALSGCAMNDPYSASSPPTARLATTTPAAPAHIAGVRVRRAAAVPAAATAPVLAFTRGYVRYLYGRQAPGRLPAATRGLRATLAVSPPRPPRSRARPVLDDVALTVSAGYVSVIASYHAGDTTGLADILFMPVRGRWTAFSADGQSPQKP